MQLVWDKAGCLLGMVASTAGVSWQVAALWTGGTSPTGDWPPT